MTGGILLAAAAWHVATHELPDIAAVGVAVSMIDDCAVDLIYLLLWLRRRIVRDDIGTTAYAAVQGRTGVDLRVSDVTVSPGGGWASVQRGHRRTIDRFDLGPGVTFRAGRFSLAAEYRFRIAGNAAPRSGPVVTLSAAF